MTWLEVWAYQPRYLIHGWIQQNMSDKKILGDELGEKNTQEFKSLKDQLV